MTITSLINIIQIDDTSEIISADQLLDANYRAPHAFSNLCKCNYSQINVSPLVSLEILNRRLLPAPEIFKATTRLRNTEIFLITHFLLRHMLGNALNLSQGFYESAFFLTSLGKPKIPDIEFSISYRNKLGGIFISKNVCGIDVEEHRHVDYLGIAHSFFSLAEQRYLSQSKNIYLDFYKIWTQKESIIKATGQGLAQMSRICVFKENHHLDVGFLDLFYKADTLIQNHHSTISFCQTTPIT